jgi:DNA (cytosine-5)-methyltransferase 1
MSSRASDKMIPLISGVLGSFSQKRERGRTGGDNDESQMGSPELLCNTGSALPPSSKPADAMNSFSHFDDETMFDRHQHTTALRRKPVSNETPESSEHSDLEANTSTQNLPEYEVDSLNSQSFLHTLGSGRELSECSAQDFPLHNIEAVSIPSQPALTNPKSQYDGFVPPLPICKERVAIEELRRAIDEEEDSQRAGNKAIYDGEDFDEFELTEFAIYLPPNLHHPYELRGLQDFASKAGCSIMLFDGILCAGPHRRYVQGVPFEICSIGNYGKEFHTVGGDIWIQTTFNKKSDLYYRLRAPSPEYQRFHSDFLWLADLAKHFVDYCEACEEGKKVVSIHNFRKEFSQWLLNSHHDSVDFRAWFDNYRGNDFRCAISANIYFLFKESIGVKDELRYQPIWSELMEKDFIPLRAIEEYQTIVTPYIYDCFGHLRFGQYLKSVAPTRNAYNQQLFQGNSLSLNVAATQSRSVIEIPSQSPSTIGNVSSMSPPRSASKIPIPKDSEMERRRKIGAIKIGDVISVTKDGEGSVWKDEVSRWKVSDHCWYVYVQAVHELHSVGRSFDGIWLYKPSDTSCAKMKYQYPNELFLSDNCTCKNGRMEGTIEEDAVIDVVSVAWHGQPAEFSKDLFIRQTYLENDRFVTLKAAHKQCKHAQSGNNAVASQPDHRYPIGQTVLVAQTKLSPPSHKSRFTLDPYEIVKYQITNSKQYAILRRLLRRNEMEGQSSCRPNELVYCDETVKVESRKIERTCLVRFYSVADATKETIPAPYSRNGTGNSFYITSKLAGDGKPGGLTPIGSHVPQSLIQGFDPSQGPSRKKLLGLDLYCGGGNFGRGLEEGQAVYNKWAVDMDKIAIHTYYANLQDPQDTHLYYGSVNDQLFQALQGNPKNSKLIPRPGEVGFISAGSPCQGFSLLNSNREKEKGLKNQSMVASVAAYVDFYRPKYGLLENVLNMAQKGKERDYDVLSQLICAIVGMGYQLATFNLDAWSCGSPQKRSRIFVAFTAPGYEPIPHPELSHSHPSYVGDRGLGMLANGQSFGERRHDLTPFVYVAAGKAVGDLPCLGDGATNTCIPYPDHVVSSAVSKEMRLQIAAIPTFPRGMNFWKAWNDGEGIMTKEQRALFPQAINGVGNARLSVLKRSRAWGRVDPHDLFGTICGTSHVYDSRMGNVIHWEQNRPLTVMEGRRTQSFPDEEVILGNAKQRIKIIGNSVDRSVALALGLSLREAWEKNSLDDDAFGGANAVKDTSAKSTRVARTHARLSEKSLGSASLSSASPAENNSPDDERGHGAAIRDVSLSVKPPRVLVKDNHGKFSKQPNRPRRAAPKRKSNSPPSGIVTVRYHHERFSQNNDGGIPKGGMRTMPSQNLKASSTRTIRDSCESEYDELLDQNGQHLLESSPLEPLNTRRAKVLQSIEIPASSSRSGSHAMSLKRPRVTVAPEIFPLKKSVKAAKLFAASSPSSPNKGVEAKSTTTSIKKTNQLQQPKGNPVNATHLGERLQVLLTQHIGGEVDSYDIDDDDSDFSGFPNSDEDSNDNNNIEIERDQENLATPSSRPSLQTTILPPSQLESTQSKRPRVITRSDRGNCKSPTKARPKPNIPST